MHLKKKLPSINCFKNFLVNSKPDCDKSKSGCCAKTSKASTSHRKPIQEALVSQIRVCESELNCMLLKRDSGLSLENIEPEIKKKN